jgi:hypothetical protein
MFYDAVSISMVMLILTSYTELLSCVFLNLISDIHSETLQETMHIIRRVI